MNIFKYLDYRIFLNDMIEKNQNIYGYKAKLAQAAGCQRSFLSQTLNGVHDLSVDHAFGLAVYWQFNNEETDYWIALLMLERASTQDLKKYYKNKIEIIQKNQENLGKRFVNQSEIIADEKFAEYYSSWLFSIVHILTTIPDSRTLDSITNKLKITSAQAQLLLNTLIKLNLIYFEDGRYYPTEKQIHLSSQSTLTATNHKNFRQLSIEHLNRPLSHNQSFFYSSAVSLDANAYQQIKDLILVLLDKSRTSIISAKEEELAIMNIDFFKFS